MVKVQTDREIIGKLFQKDERTLITFYRQYSVLLNRYLYHQVKDVALAEEITQDVFIDFLESMRDFRYQSSLKTYLFSIAHHKVVDYFRKKRLKKILFSSLPGYIVESLKVFFIDEEIDQKEMAQKINHTLNKLPNDYELVLRLKYIEGEKVQKIAERLAIKFKAAESLVFRARKAFVKIFSSSS